MRVQRSRLLCLVQNKELKKGHKLMLPHKLIADDRKSQEETSECVYLPPPRQRLGFIFKTRARRPPFIHPCRLDRAITGNCSGTSIPEAPFFYFFNSTFTVTPRAPYRKGHSRRTLNIDKQSTSIARKSSTGKLFVVKRVKCKREYTTFVGNTN